MILRFISVGEEYSNYLLCDLLHNHFLRIYHRTRTNWFYSAYKYIRTRHNYPSPQRCLHDGMSDLLLNQFAC